MNHKEFSTLSGTEQYNMLVKEGVQVGMRRGAIFNYYLYQLHSFYIEIKVDKAGHISNIISFTCIEFLDLYTEKIDPSVLTGGHTRNE